MTIVLEIDVAQTTISLEPEVVIVAGYTGADAVAVQHHIDELAVEGIAPPPRVPMYWAMPPSVLTQASIVEVPSAQTSGEIELALVADGDEIYLAAGSDHTCREAEAIDVRLSKLICPTPISRQAWRWSDVSDRWQDLRLSSRINEGADAESSVTYQDAVAAGNRPPIELLAAVPWAESGRPRCFVLLCGTVPAIGGIRAAHRFIATITDPLTKSTLGLDYRVRPVRQLASVKTDD